MPSERASAVIGIALGARPSTGDDLRRLLTGARSGSGLAIVLVQGQDAAGRPLRAAELRSATAMPVVDLEQDTAIAPDRLYVAAPDREVAIRGGRFVVSAPLEDWNGRSPPDLFFRSLASELGDRAVAVMLMGGGRESALGIRMVKELGGLVVAQERPDGLANRDPAGPLIADLVLPPEDIVEAVAHYVADGPDRPDTEQETGGARTLLRILSILRRRTGHDFRGFKPSALTRRIRYRMAIRRIPRLSEYLKVLERQKAEAERLANDVLIGVAQFFRDPNAFEALGKRVIEPLVRSKWPDRPIRIWVPGCATGEEAYSIAMLVAEHLPDGSAASDIRIFATDLDDAALAVARAGVYTPEVAADVGPKRLRRFFRRLDDGGYRVNRNLRDMITFARHEILTDAPFARLDLVSCRRVVIHLDPQAHAHVIAQFHFALNKGGALILGRSEGVAHDAGFETLSNRFPIYRRVARRRRAHGATAGRAAERRTGRAKGETRAPRRAAQTPRPPRGGRRPQAARGVLRASETDLIGALKRELQAAQQTMRSTVEELNAAHEEVASLTDDLDSRQNDLAVAKEEIQAANEELTAINRQLREKMEELSAASNDASNLLRSSETPTLFLDEELRIKRYTAASEKLFHLQPSDLGRRIDDLAWAVHDPDLVGDAAGVLASLTPVEAQVQADDGRWFVRRILPYRTEDGAVRGVVITLSDVTLLKNTEQHWRRLAAVLSDSNDALTVQDFEGQVLAWNLAATKMYGYTEAEAVGTNVFERLVPEPKREELRRVIARLRRCEVVPSFETLRIGRSGQILEVWLTVTALKDENGRPIAFATTERDITERNRAEQALRESERFANAVFENAPVGIQIFGPDGSLQRMNIAQRRMPTMPMRADDRICNVLTDPAIATTELGDAFRKAYESRVVALPEMSLPRPEPPGKNGAGPAARAIIEGLLFPVRDEAWRVQAVVSFCWDVSERKGAREAQRLESLGVLAGGIAHDFNNLLAAMLGNIALATAELPRGSSVAEPLDQARIAAERAVDLTRQMLAYAGRRSFEVRPWDLNTIVRDNVSLLRAAVSKRVQLVADLAEWLPPIDADVGQLQQVLMNLIMNAAEATGDAGGTVTMVTRVRELDAEEAARLSRLAGSALDVGTYVGLDVIDRGQGMDAATMARIFDPLFTTKATGRGLGLSAMLGIVKRHRGGIAVESEIGRGTTFEVVFPAGRVARTSDMTAAKVTSLDSTRAAPDGRTVLVIDDEPIVRQTYARLLEWGGFRSIQAADGAEALALYDQRASEIALVLLDLSMPGMPAADTVRALRARNPEARILLMSGHAQAGPAAELDGVVAFLSKPTPSQVFLDAVRRACGAPAPTTV